MDYIINFKQFNIHGVYELNNEISILTLNGYKQIWNSENENTFIKTFDKIGLNNNNCLFIQLNNTGDEYLILWDMKNNKFYDMDCNDMFVLMDDTRFAYCLILSLCDDVIVFNYENVGINYEK